MIAGAERQGFKSGLPLARDPGHSHLKTARRIWKLAVEIGAEWHPRLGLAHVLLSILPPRLGSRVRSWAYRQLGFRIGRNVCILGNITFDGDKDLYDSLAVGDECLINTPLHLNLGARVAIGNRVGIGHHTVLITDTHEIGPSGARMGVRKSLPITIEDGVWICARATILPGLTIGRGSVVAAGAVVARNVPPDTIVAGVPARIVRLLPRSSPRLSTESALTLTLSQRERGLELSPEMGQFPLPPQRERVRVRVVPAPSEETPNPVNPVHPCSNVPPPEGAD